MRRLTITIILLIMYWCALIPFVKVAKAQPQIIPIGMSISLLRGEESRFNMTVRNSWDTSINISVAYVDVAGGWMKVKPQDEGFTLPSGASRVINITLKAPSTVKPGLYYGGLDFNVISHGIISMATEFSVHVRVPGVKIVSLQVTQVKASEITCTLNCKNYFEESAVVTANVEVLNSSGGIIDKTKSGNITFTKDEAKNIVLQMNTYPPAGLYTARASILYISPAMDESLPVSKKFLVGEYSGILVDYSVTGISGTDTIMEGEDVIFTAVFKNTGDFNLSAYSMISVYTADEQMLFTVESDSFAVNPQETVTLKSIKNSEGATGTYLAKIKVVYSAFEGDVEETDEATVTFNVSAHPGIPYVMLAYAIVGSVIVVALVILIMKRRGVL